MSSMKWGVLFFWRSPYRFAFFLALHKLKPLTCSSLCHLWNPPLTSALLTMNQHRALFLAGTLYDQGYCIFTLTLPLSFRWHKLEKKTRKHIICFCNISLVVAQSQLVMHLELLVFWGFFWKGFVKKTTLSIMGYLPYQLVTAGFCEPSTILGFQSISLPTNKKQLRK